MLLLFLGFGFIATGGTPHETFCKNNPAKNSKVCVLKSNGHGSDCVVRTCGGWFSSDCDCYDTGVEK